MTFAHALATNNYGPCKFIVATSPANGTHTTLASAMAAASVGDTIFLRDSVTENVTITPGVNIANFQGGSLNTPSITGTLTMTGAGTSNINGIRLVTNSAAAIAVTGSAASILNINNCYLDFTNNTGITFSSSSSSAQILFTACLGNLGTTGIAIYTHTSAGNLIFLDSVINNSGGSSTASTSSAGQVNFTGGGIFSPISTSSTATCSFSSTFINSTAQNVTSLTTSGTSQGFLRKSTFTGGTASAISIGSGTTVNMYDICEIVSSNTNAVTGAGALQFGTLYFNTGSSNLLNVSTMSPITTTGGGWSRLQTKTASSSATLDFTSIPIYPVYAVVFNNIRPATNAQDLELLASSDNGSTYASTGYTSGINFNAFNSILATNATSTTYGIMARSQSNGVGLYGTVFLTPGNGGWWGQMSFFNTTAAATTLGFVLGSAGIVFNALRFQFASGNITSGSVVLYGLNQ